MGRSVVLAGAARCPRCSLPPRWCTCDMLPPVATRLAVHVLIHRHESVKPSSTGRLVARAVSGAASRVYQRETKFHPAATFSADEIDPAHEMWILHPNGQPLPSPPDAGNAPFDIRRHILLLDGTWRQAGEMLQTVKGMGLCVRLPNASDEPSRNWLRNQADPGRLSTAEALMHVFRAVGDDVAEHGLRLHFELHVYATLLARGRREMAERYLGHSPLLTNAPEALDRLHSR
ncbi:MAG: tRNA-uridine aminocarboxypropyltransferase [Planctomycetia bacterium]